MHTLIIYCHPYQKSFNHAILDAVQQSLRQSNLNYQTIDLYADDFSPAYSTEELKLYHSGKTTDPLVEKYLKLLKTVHTVIIISPVWWNSVPGMLKGFIDKVMKEGENLSHTVTKLGVKGELRNIKRCYLITTSSSPTFYIRFFNGNGIKKIFLNQTLKQLGFQGRSWINLGMISTTTAEKRKKFLKSMQLKKFE
ncbi:NAD(P)H-dependent oxidoreductase [Leuconostoc citreum]|uniref:NAD(P)H-dependent oxidoreductase n=1 Tax=Leuconostoc citreum TaxID=33964 RepID=UPI0025A02EBD|nr:NAD(P)H-dependent oxidoreductase [Leuconostoc citreum]MDM7642679.1 NAD(P)H-dependent oxidoreductase [Leuconostoc citreum]